MSSPPRRRHKNAPMEEVQSAVRTKRQRLPEPDAPPAAENRGSRASSDETTAQTCGEGHLRPGAPETRQYLELDKLPEDMLHHIHSLMPVQEAARAACISRRFLRSWRGYSNLILNTETLGLTDDLSEGSEIRYINKIDKILNSYSGNGMKVKTLRIDLVHCKSVSASYLDRWLRIAVKSGISGLSLSLPYSMKEMYFFPCSVLFDLFCVQITETGLQLLLSKSSNLERLQMYSSSEIICLKIPCTLQKLKFLIVQSCQKIQVVDISAPNLSTFHYYNGFPLEISIRDPSQLKDVYLSSLDPSRIVSYGRAKLPSISPNVERLNLLSRGEIVNTPMRPDKFLHLKSLGIRFHRSGDSPVYNIFSALSFLDASPALEYFILHAERDAIIRDCVAEDDLYLRRESAYQYYRLRRVKITGFHSAKSLIKLVIHILESAHSLESLTLDTARGNGRKPGDTRKCAASGGLKCCLMSERDLEDADGAVEAAGKYIVGRVPSAVEFEVLEPCRRCYAGKWQHIDHI